LNVLNVGVVICAPTCSSIEQEGEKFTETCRGVTEYGRNQIDDMNRTLGELVGRISNFAKSLSV